MQTACAATLLRRQFPGDDRQRHRLGDVVVVDFDEPIGVDVDLGEALGQLGQGAALASRFVIGPPQPEDRFEGGPLFGRRPGELCEFEPGEVIGRIGAGRFKEADAGQGAIAGLHRGDAGLEADEPAGPFAGLVIGIAFQELIEPEQGELGRMRDAGAQP